MSEALLPNADNNPPVGQLATAAVDATGAAGSLAVVSTPTLEPLAAVPDELRRLGVDYARIVADAGRAALVWVSIFVLYGSQRPLSQGALLGITIAAAVWLASFRCVSFEQPAVPIRMAAAALGTAVGLGVVAALDQTAVGLHVSLGSLVLLALGVLASVLAWDWVVDRTLEARKRVLLVGSANVDGLLEEELRTSPHAHFDIVGAVPVAEEITEIVNAQRPDIVVLTDEHTYGAAIERLLDARANVRVAGFASFVEYALGRVPIDQITPAWFMSLLHPRQRIYTRFTKRTFDVAFALIGLIVTAPLLGLLMLGMKLAGGPVLYRQTRMGEDGRPFTINKLRTMRCDAEQDGAAFSMKDDPRTTRIGQFLRSTHLDELPQLWNVLKGEMSIVGPRPERPEFIEMIEATVPFWNRRLLVKPGITGWAQVRCGYASDYEAMETKLSYDLWYLRNQSLLVDLSVCLLTVTSLFARPGKA
jgi:exopolysaccharide biosynthesis polyprenyl glycosylphosphotransferase